MALNKDKIIAAAQKFVEKGQYEKAVKEYLKITAEDPSDVRVLLKLGDTYAKKGDKPEATETYLTVAKIYSDQGFVQKAIAVYKQVLRLDPRLVDVNFKLADLYRQLGLMSDAMQQYELAANFLHREGRVKEALDALRHMVELEPSNVASRIKLAEAYSKEGKVEEAIAEFTRAADALRQSNRVEDFVKVAERLVFHQPDNLAVQLELAELYLKRSDPKRALPKLQVCFKADPRNLRVLGLLAEAFEQLGQLGKTISVLKETARIHAENGNARERDATYRRVLKLAPGDAEALEALQASADGGAEATGARLPSSRVAVPVSTDTEESGAVQLSDEDLVEATPAVVELEVSEPVEETAGRPAAGAFEEVVEVGGAAGAEEMPTGEGEVLLDADVEPIVEEDVAEDVARILAETDVYMKYGLFDKALEHVRRVFELDSANLEGHERLKEIYLHLGDTGEAVAELLFLARATQADKPEDAVAYCRQILELEPDNEPAQNLLRKIELRPSAAFRPVPAAHRDATGPGPGFPGLDSTAEDEAGPDIPVEIDGEVFDEEVEAFEDVGITGSSLRIIAEGASPGATGASEEAPTSHAIPEPGLPLEDAVPEGRPVAGVSASSLGATPRIDVGFDADMASIEEIVPPDLTSLEVRGGAIPYPRALPDEPTRAFPKIADEGNAITVETVEEELLALQDRQAPRPAREEALLAPGGSGAPAPRDGGGGVATGWPGQGHVAVSPGPAGAAQGAQGAEGIEDDLDQAEFLMQQGLFDDAKEVLEGVLAGHPGNPLVLAKIRELEEAAHAAGVELEPITRPASPRPAELGGAMPLEPPPPAPRAPAAVSLQPEASEVPAGEERGASPPVENHAFSQPIEAPDRSGSVVGRVGDQPIDTKDFETHYDLGIAYKEMGLYNEAIREFEMIAQAPGREVLCHTMIGLCYSARGMLSEAISQFKKGLYVEGISEQETVSLYYELGSAYEKLDDPREALYYYEKVAKRDPRFRDVAERLAETRRKAEGKAARGEGTADGDGPAA